ncbi:unnamed protein product [Allacma fusca]|uniref:WD repeat-containing protein 63 n=1 Tax=Allacma fusca TaxID=39272 RepID=A0A8J2P0V0_9HEXA|nr:unnamed protein product [Allacma fusca]
MSNTNSTPSENKTPSSDDHNEQNEAEEETGGVSRHSSEHIEEAEGDQLEEQEDVGEVDIVSGGEPPSTIRSHAGSTGQSETEGAGETEDETALDPMAKKRREYEERKKKKKEEEQEKQDQVEEQEHDEDEDETSLLYRHDSELTPRQIVDKDILWYDLLLANEDLMDMPAPTAPVEIVEEPEVHIEEEEVEEEEITDEPSEAEEEEEEAPQEEETAQMESMDIDDPDNIVNMMMQQQDEDEDDLKILFQTDAFNQDQETDTLANQDGIVGITLSDETKQFLEIETDLSEWHEKFTWLSTKRVLLHIYIYEEKSEFAPFYKLIKSYPDFAMLMGIDFLQQTGNTFYLCVTPEARNYVLNPPKKRKVFVDLKKKEEEAWDKLASIVPRKWRSLGSELEVDAESIKNSRPLLTVYAYRYSEYFFAETNFQDSKYPEGSECSFTEFPSKDLSDFPGIERKEINKGVQVNPPKISTESQTGFSFKRNKMVQHEVQFIAPEEAETTMAIPEFQTFLNNARTPIERALQQNEMLNTMADDYHNLRAVKGHEVEFNNESVLLQEYQTYADLRHSKGRCVTYMTFHPLLDEVVIMAFTEDVTFDRKIEYHSKTLMDPNFVLIWDLKDPSRPQLMLDAPSDVYSFMVSPSDPNLVCGGCENGQVVLWDLGRHYIELRNKIQDRKQKNQESSSKSQTFLEKLKDSAEKYVCPLIPTAGMSNLDSSHKRGVTAVHWLPPHVELGKNGNLYDSSWNGRSPQFFSVAGDSSARVWDIRVQKLGLDEFDAPPVASVKVNPWHHLENNTWKFSMKFTLDDGSGTMYCNVMTLSEGKIGDTLTVDSDSWTGTGSVGSAPSGDTIDSLKSFSSLGTASQIAVRKSTRGHKPSSHISEPDQSRSIIDAPSVDHKPSSVGTGSAHSKSIAGGDADFDNINAMAKRAGGMMSTTNALTSFFAGTETGHVALIDWLRNKDGSINPDASGNKVCQNMFIMSTHDGAITSIQRSPFHHELILVVGGGTVSIWKEHAGSPILATLGGENFPWCGCWSTTRPGVFFCGTREGSLQVWDLMEKSHAPVLTQQISPGRIVTVATPKALTQKKHFLAVGDSQGNLFVMLIPRYYSKLQPSENQTIVELMNREESRMSAWVSDTESRQERIRVINQQWKDKRVQKTEKELHEKELRVEARLSAEYLDFLEFQAKLATKLKREEPELPTDELDIDAELDALVQAAEEKEMERLKEQAAEESNNEAEEEAEDT